VHLTSGIQLTLCTQQPNGESSNQPPHSGTSTTYNLLASRFYFGYGERATGACNSHQDHSLKSFFGEARILLWRRPIFQLLISRPLNKCPAPRWKCSVMLVVYGGEKYNTLLRSCVGKKEKNLLNVCIKNANAVLLFQADFPCVMLQTYFPTYEILRFCYQFRTEKMISQKLNKC
jgi:hypothetical protein